MSGRILDDSEAELFEKIKQDYFNNDHLDQKSLAEKYKVKYGKLLSVSRHEKWKQERDDKIKQESENLKIKKAVNGGSRIVESETQPVSNSNSSEKGGSPFSESDTTVNKQVEILRNDAFELATSAAESLASREDWNPKDFDLLVGTFAKVVGVQMKMEGNEDGIDRLFSELTDTEVFRTPSAKSEEGADES